ncbi:MAG: CapA family protein [Planctomycetota bacterium]
MKINKINLPQSALSIYKLKGFKRLIMNVVHKCAPLFGYYDYPLDVKLYQQDPEDLIKDPKFLNYWMYKTIKPVARAEKGSGLEEHFVAQQTKPADMLPAGFSVEQELTLSFSGDLMCTEGAQNSKDLVYQGVADKIFDVDVAYANLESTLTKGEVRGLEFDFDKGTPEINMTPDQYQTFIQHQGRHYDIVQLSNNHILDCGEEGITTTRECLDRDKVAHAGTNMSPEEAGRGVILEKNGLKIGYVAFTFSVNFRPFPEGKDYMVNMVPFHLSDNPDTAPIVKQINWCREQGCDLVVLALHWGLEFEFYPHPDQLKWAHMFAEAGADIIIGHHPHVAQPMEYYRSKRDNDRIVPIFYSLGNLSPVMSSAFTVLSMIAKLKVARGEKNDVKATYVTDVDITPTAMVSTTENNNYTLRLLKVADIRQMELTPEMQDYAAEITSYSDMLLGDSWRQ